MIVKRHQTENIWLTIYADMITNLLLLFLALYGLSILGKDALAQAILSMKINDLEKLQTLLEKDDFDRIQGQLRSHLKMDNISILKESGSVRLELGESILFASGQANTKLSAETVLVTVAQMLKTLPYTIIVEGHTDNVPLTKKHHFKNNRELSMARAMSIVRWMIDVGQIPAGQLAAASYGEFKPRSSNETAAGRAMNRRVEILLMKDFSYKKEAIQ